MASGQNFAVKLCGILQSQSSHDVKAREWRLVGQEQDGSQLLTWSDENYVSNIGVYSSKKKSFDVLYTFDDHLNIIQASVNSSHTLLVYVVKEKAENANGDLEDIYKPFMITLRSTKNREISDIANGDNKQMMVQFLYGKSHKYNPTCHNDKFILFTHLTCIKIYFTKLVNSDSDDELDDWDLVGTLPSPDIIVKTFSWAQWDCVHQVLYYIHYRQPTQSFAEGEEVKSPSEIMPTLSALQFHADLPHETVLNIPLSLPQLPTSNTGPACGQYEDDPVPLRIHDCSLDLQIVSDSSGVVCICHHYLYKPLDDSTSSLALEDSTELKDSGVNFAYSITLLHHGCVVHSVVPDVPWTLAKSLRPSFSLYGDNHLLVRIPNLYTHLLDVGLSHEPCCHIVLPNINSENGPSLSTLIGWGPNTMIDLSTLDIVTIVVTEKELIAAFKSDISMENKISILHYFIQHECNSEAADELVSWLCVNQRDTFGALQRVMEEYLIATSYTATKKSLPTSALPLTRLLPYTQHTKFVDVKIRDVCISVSQEKLWNTAVVLLAPRQRVAQFAEDLWTRLWEYLTPGSPRFKCSQVLEKLRVSLDCYQPEALSRCTTPMSPCTSAPLMVNPPIRRSSTTQGDFLPFFEVDMCTASKQEHIISVRRHG